MQWLGFSLAALARQKPVIMASISHCPPPLQLPTGPIWACTADDEAGYLLPGRPETQLRQAARSLLNQTATSQELSIPLNPWVGNDDPKHNLRLHLRKLTTSDLSRMMLLDGKLRIGRGCSFDVESLEVHDERAYDTNLPVQARHMQHHTATFAPADAHVAIFGAGALAHQIVQLLSDSPVTVHWEAAASERMMPRRAANVLRREPVDDNPKWLPDNSHCLVMTHDHPLDFRLCAALAKQAQTRSVGVVGSQRKCERLQSFLDEQLLSESQRSKIRCPIGGSNALSLSAAALTIAHEVTQLTSATFFSRNP